MTCLQPGNNPNFSSLILTNFGIHLVTPPLLCLFKLYSASSSISLYFVKRVNSVI